MVLIALALSACTTEDTATTDGDVELVCNPVHGSYCEAAYINAWSLCNHKRICDGLDQSQTDLIECVAPLVRRTCELRDCTAPYLYWDSFDACVIEYQESCTKLPCLS
jgi:hypothetical protein